VVVCAYQAAHQIGEAIESLLAQTVRPHELIVCDDGSTDGLFEALSPFAGHITYLRQEHKGLAAARNLGLSHASGNFIVGCDADDAQKPFMLEALGEFAMTRPDLDILSRASLVERDGKILDVSNTPRDPRFSVENQRMAILRSNFLRASAAVRRKRLLGIGGYDESLKCAEDYDVWVRLLFSGSRAGVVLEPLGVYRSHPGSLSTKEIWCLEGLLAIFSKLSETADLSEEEGRVVEERRAVLRRDLGRAEARARARSALLEGQSDARAQCVRLALDRGQSLRTRLKAALCVAMPRKAARQL
jgi:glycosyltransferase involved in cell wall biosynthesis